MKKKIVFLLIILFSSVSLRLYAQRTGINLPVGATTPNTTLDINGAIAFREGAAISVTNGNNNDITLSAYSLFRLTGATAAFTLTGFTGGVDGRLLTVVNTTAQNMTLNHQTSSATANQLYLTNSSNLTISPNGSATFQYNSTLSKWVLVSSSSNDWSTIGNQGTTPTSHFLGTTDNQNLAIRTNNRLALTVTTEGRGGTLNFANNRSTASQTS